MTAEPHERPEFHNSVEYTVTLTLRVAGGARHGTADRRGQRAAEKLANAAARLADVVEVSAVAGHSRNGAISWPRRVHFAAANTGQGATTAPDKLDRYLDPEHERALASLAAANARQRARQDADRKRRREVSCRNPYRWASDVACGCVYCQPGLHLAQAADARLDPDNPYGEHTCLCGDYVTRAGERCLHHRHAQLVVLDGDAPELTQLAEALAPHRDADRDRDARRDPTAPRPLEGPDPDIDP